MCRFKMSKIVDSICLKILTSTKLLRGNGNTLEYYHVNDRNKTRRVACPESLRDKIHGIIVQELSADDYLVVYYGVRELAFTNLKENKFHDTTKVKISDWISTAHFYAEPFKFCFVTGHNIIQEVRIDMEQRSFDLTKKSWCEDASTLYCATVKGSDWNSLVVFAGTALGDLLIWYPRYGMDKLQRCTVQHRLNGHNGVIFSIAVDLGRQLIVTTSDDRSVRFWQTHNGETMTVTPGKQVFGHIARVFKSCIIQEENTTLIASAGEDSYLCLWTESGTLLCKRKLNFGATIWDIDYCPLTKTIFTSSSDSNICKLNIKPYLAASKRNQLEIIEFIAPQPEEYMAKIKFLQSDVLIGLTNSNRLVFKIGEGKWSSLDIELDYKSCLLEVNGNFIVTAGYESITWFKYVSGEMTIVKAIKLPNSMMRAFHFVESGFIACDESGFCYKINKWFEIETTFNIPNCKEKWTTVCFVVGSIILAGDRCGNLHYFRQESETNRIQLKTTLKLVHGNLGITNIWLIESNDRVVGIKTSGHDGTVKSIELSKLDDTVAVYHTEKTDVIWIEKILGHRIFGFNDNFFVVWEKYNGVIHELECGGRHRNWDVNYDSVNSTFTFLFIRNKKLFRNKFVLADSENTISLENFNWHIESCNAADLLEIEGFIFVVSGSDDNLLKVSRIVDNEFRNYFEIFSHISNIRSVMIRKSEGGHLILSAGGRAQICATEICSSSGDNIKIKEIGNFMLKYNDAQRKRIRNPQEIDFDPETRFMCLACVGSNIYAGCSDGYIRTFEMHQGQINFVSSTFYGTCILNVAVLENHRIILTMGTDGYVCFWNLADFKQLLKLKHHDSGVNCFDLFSLSQHGYRLISGGDDQSVTLSEFFVQEHNREGYTIDVCNTLSSIALHSAQVTGIKFFNDKFAYSVGVDQMINKMDLSNLKAISSRFTCVSDPKGLRLLSDNKKIIVYGAGIEINDLI